MDSFEKIERTRNARRRRRAQQLRAGALRSRVVAISLVCFALLWGIVFVQMATGDDPVLGPAPHGSRTASRPRSSGASSSPPLESQQPEVIEPEPVEPEFVEPEVEVEEPQFEEEFEEPEVIEPEPEPEPAPVVTSSS